MKKLGYIILLLLVIPVIVKADINIENKDTENKELDSSSLIYGEEVTTTNITKGIEFLIGSTVNQKGNSDYSLILGGTINIDGTINNDGFIFGSVININEDANINRDLTIFGSEVQIDGKINRDVMIYATSVVINGEVSGNLNIKANNIEINEAKVGTLEYNEDAIINISNSDIKETNLTDAIYQEQTVIDNVMNFIISLLSILLLFGVICLIVPQLFRRINEKNKKFDALKFFSLFGFGALSLILIPSILVILFGLVFTIPLALLLLALFILAVCLSTIFTGYLLGYIIWNKFIKKEENLLLIGLIGISIISVLASLPNIGIVFIFVAIMIGMGIILQQFRKE